MRCAGVEMRAHLCRLLLYLPSAVLYLKLQLQNLCHFQSDSAIQSFSVRISACEYSFLFPPGFAFSFTCLSLFQLSVQLQGVRYFSLFFFFLFAGRHYVLRTVGVGARGVWCRGGQVIVVQAERERDGQSVQTRLALNTPNYISIHLQRWRLI